MFALLMGATIVSCNQKPEQPADANADSTKVEAAAPADQAPNLADVVAKMKAEGANWTEDQWRDALGQVMLAVKPMFVKMEALLKKIELGDANAAAEMEALSKSKEAKEMEALMEEVDIIVNENPVGKKVYNDSEWAKKFRAENGIPEL